MATLNEFVLTKCTDAEQANAALDKLIKVKAAVDEERVESSRAANATSVEAWLKSRRPKLELLAGDTTLSGPQLVDAICADANLLSSSSDKGKLSSQSDNDTLLRDDAIRDAINSESFAACVADVEKIDTSSAQGRRAVIERGFLARNPLITRVLHWGAKDLAKRHPLLALMLEVRGGNSFSGLAEYLSYVHAVDIDTGEVPLRARRFSVLGEAGTYEVEIKKWINLKLHEINWFCPHSAIYALRMALTGAKLAPLDARDHLCILTEMEDLIEFGERRLTSFGVPAVLEGNDTGFTWRTFWARYVSHLKLARRASTKDEMLAWVQQTVTQGARALKLMSDSLLRFVGAIFPASAKLGALLPADNAVITIFQSREEGLNTFLSHRDIYAWVGVGGQTSAPLSTEEIPRLSLPSSQRRLAASGNTPLQHRPDNSGANQPKGSGPRHLGSDKLVNSGFVWRVKDLEAHPGMKGRCVNFITSARSPANRQAGCVMQHLEGHRFPGDTAHTDLPNESFESLAKKYATPFSSAASRAPSPGATKRGRGGRGTPGQSVTQPPALRSGVHKTTGGRGGRGGRGGGGSAKAGGANTSGPTPPAYGKGGRGGNTQVRGGYSTFSPLTSAVFSTTSLPMPAGLLEELTSRGKLDSAFLGLLDMLVLSGRGIVDLGGCGDCGDKAIAFAITKLGVPIAHEVVRELILDLARSDRIFDLHITDVDETGTFTKGISFAKAICNSLATWPAKVYEEAVAQADKLGGLSTRAGVRCLVDFWIEEMQNTSTYADVAFCILAAHIFQVLIVAFVVRKDGSQATLPQMIMPAFGTPPLARIELANIVDVHICPVIFVSALAELIPTAVQLRVVKHSKGCISSLGWSQLGWVLLQGSTPPRPTPLCEEPECSRQLLRLWSPWQQDAALALSQSLEAPSTLEPKQAPKPEFDTLFRFDGPAGSVAVACPHQAWVHVCGLKEAGLTFCPKAGCIRFARNLWSEECSTLVSQAKSEGNAALVSQLRLVLLQERCLSAASADHGRPPINCAFVDTVWDDHLSGTILQKGVQFQFDDLPTTALPSSSEASEMAALPSAADPPLAVAMPESDLNPGRLLEFNSPVTVEELIDLHSRGSNADSAIRKRGIVPDYLSSTEARAEFLSFAWPLRSLDEVRRLLRCKHIAPVNCSLFEFTGCVRVAREQQGFITISCDLRESLVPGMHVCCDARLLFDITDWQAAFAFPPCYNHLRADEHTIQFKLNDSRAFFAGLLVIRCAYIRGGGTIVIEQPDSLVSDLWPFSGLVEFRTSNMGDSPDKFVRLSLVRGRLQDGLLPADRSTRRPKHDSRIPYLDYESAEARDRDKSSWVNFVNTVRLVTSVEFAPEVTLPFETYEAAAEYFAVQWHLKYPGTVPAGYLDPLALPPAELREYQFVRGKGDGRIPPRVIPRSLTAPAAPSATSFRGGCRQPPHVIKSPAALSNLLVSLRSQLAGSTRSFLGLSKMLQQAVEESNVSATLGASSWSRDQRAFLQHAICSSAHHRASLICQITTLETMYPELAVQPRLAPANDRRGPPPREKPVGLSTGASARVATAVKATGPAQQSEEPLYEEMAVFSLDELCDLIADSSDREDDTSASPLDYVKGGCARSPTGPPPTQKHPDAPYPPYVANGFICVFGSNHVTHTDSVRGGAKPAPTFSGPSLVATSTIAPGERVVQMGWMAQTSMAAAHLKQLPVVPLSADTVAVDLTWSPSQPSAWTLLRSSDYPNTTPLVLGDLTPCNASMQAGTCLWVANRFISIGEVITCAEDALPLQGIEAISTLTRLKKRSADLPSGSIAVWDGAALLEGGLHRAQPPPFKPVFASAPAKSAPKAPHAVHSKHERGSFPPRPPRSGRWGFTRRRIPSGDWRNHRSQHRSWHYVRPSIRGGHGSSIAPALSAANRLANDHDPNNGSRSLNWRARPLGNFPSGGPRPPDTSADSCLRRNTPNQQLATTTATTEATPPPRTIVYVAAPSSDSGSDAGPPGVTPPNARVERAGSWSRCSTDAPAPLDFEPLSPPLTPASTSCACEPPFSLLHPKDEPPPATIAEHPEDGVGDEARSRRVCGCNQCGLYLSSCRNWARQGSTPPRCAQCQVGCACDCGDDVEDEPTFQMCVNGSAPSHALPPHSPHKESPAPELSESTSALLAPLPLSPVEGLEDAQNLAPVLPPQELFHELFGVPLSPIDMHPPPSENATAVPPKESWLLKPPLAGLESPSQPPSVTSLEDSVFVKAESAPGDDEGSTGSFLLCDELVESPDAEAMLDPRLRHPKAARKKKKRSTKERRRPPPAGPTTRSALRWEIVKDVNGGAITAEAGEPAVESPPALQDAVPPDGNPCYHRAGASPLTGGHSVPLPTPMARPQERLGALSRPLRAVHSRLESFERGILDVQGQAGDCGPDAIAEGLSRLGVTVSSNELRRQVAETARSKTARQHMVSVSGFYVPLHEVIHAAAINSDVDSSLLLQAKSLLALKDKDEDLEQLEYDAVIECWAAAAEQPGTFADIAFLAVVALIFWAELVTITVDELGEETNAASVVYSADGTPVERRIELACHARHHFALIVLLHHNTLVDIAKRKRACESSSGEEPHPEEPSAVLEPASAASCASKRTKLRSVRRQVVEPA